MTQVHDLLVAQISNNFIHRIDVITEGGWSYVVLRCDMGNLSFATSDRRAPGFQDEKDAKAARDNIRASVARALHADANRQPTQIPSSGDPRMMFPTLGRRHEPGEPRQDHPEPRPKIALRMPAAMRRQGRRPSGWWMVLLTAIATVGAALLGMIVAAGCSQTPGLGPDDPWIGSELPRPVTFTHVGPGTWIVTDVQGGTTTLRSKE